MLEGTQRECNASLIHKVFSCGPDCPEQPLEEVHQASQPLSEVRRINTPMILKA